MSENKHTASDLAQMQSLPLEAKIRMTKERIKVWYESWCRYEIYDTKTKKTRFVTLSSHPEDLYFIKVPSKKKPKKLLVTSEQIRLNKYEVLDKQPYLKDSEYIESCVDGQVYVSCSFGKDSIVLKHIVDSMYNDVPSVFANTGLEYPEIQKLAREVKSGKYDCFNSDVEIIRPEMRFDEVIKKYGYPVVSKAVSRKISDANKGLAHVEKFFDGSAIDKHGNLSRFNCAKWKFLIDAPFKVTHKCCDVMKKKPFSIYEKVTNRKPYIGTMASESTLRENSWLKTGCNAFESKKPKSQPMSFWTEQDVLEYIVKYKVPYASVYGQIQEEGELEGQMFIDGFHTKLCTTGVDRTGCMFCMFGCHLDRLGVNGDKNRFQVMKETHPKQYAYCMKPVSEGGLGIKEVLEYIGVPYE